MCKILLSINPEHVKNIISGKKKYEYRKVKCQRHIDSILIYSTSPIMKVVAEVEVENIIEDTPDNVWEKTKKQSGIEKDFFDKYFYKRERAYAFSLGKLNIFDKVKTLADFGVKNAPQSFVYLDK